MLPTLNVLENVCLPLEFQGVKFREAVTRGREMLKLVGMEKREHHFLHQLSGGEMQRTAIARALVHRPKVLLADEPTGNLDVANADKVLEIFRRIADERLTTLIVVTHSVEVAETAERRIHLRNGKIVESEKRSACRRRIWRRTRRSLDTVSGPSGFVRLSQGKRDALPSPTPNAERRTVNGER